MGRKKLYVNTVAALISQVFTILCGFILPRFMLSAYGSTINGLVSSISQFLGIISFMQLGVGAVVQSALYEPLAKKNNKLVSEIYSSSSKFFRTIALIFTAYVFLLIIVYPKSVAAEFDYWFSASIILILAVNLFAQYYFGLTNQILLYADQKAYIPLLVDGVTLVLSTVLSIILIDLGMSIQIVKGGSSLVFILRPLIMSLYVNRHYEIDKHVSYSVEPIKQKWNGLIQHVASTIMDNTDVMILTVFSTLENVSVYYIYNLIVFGIRQLVVSVTVGIQSYLGHLLVRYDVNKVKQVFSTLEILIHVIITILFSCVLLLIVPFVRVYTNGIDDTNYIVPVFAAVISLAQAIYCYRLIYYIVIKSAGHFKQTQMSATIEIGINLVTSVICVARFGLIGVALGTLAATTYRAVYFICYLNRNIIFIDLPVTIKRFMTDALIIILSYCCLSEISMMEVSYYGWFLIAMEVTPKVMFITCLCTVVELCLFEKGKWKDIVEIFNERIRKR